MKVRFTTYLLAGILTVLGSAQALYLATTWASIDATPAACTQDARAALQLAGLGQGFNVAGDSVYGGNDDYVASVRCLTGEKVLFVSVAGPDGKRAQAYAQTVQQTFLSMGLPTVR